jgi:SH3-like domain-containing protein
MDLRRLDDLIFMGKSWFGPGMSGAQPICAVAGGTLWRLASCLLGFAILVAAGAAPSAHEATSAPGFGPGRLPIPRFVSLKSDRVNLRQGPGTEYPIAWVFRRSGLPLEVIKEFEGWRQVRDADGTTGWILGVMLSGRRTALVLPWEAKAGQRPVASATLREAGSEQSRAVARVEAGVLAAILGCDGHWCRVGIDSYRGYIKQTTLWGAYEGEVIK